MIINAGTVWFSYKNDLRFKPFGLKIKKEERCVFMKKVFALFLAAILITSLSIASVPAGAAEVPKMELTPNPPVPGQKLTAVYTQSETPAFFGWYVFDAADIDNANGVYSIKSTADWGKAGLPQYGATIDLPATTGGKFLYAKAGRGADKNYSTIQESNVVKISGGEAEAPKAPPAPVMPSKKITIFGFESIADGVNIGVADSDKGPSEIRRANGEVWNADANSWASIQYSTFTDLYQFNSVKDSKAPEGKKVGKWINKMGEKVPDGKGEWTSSLLNVYLNEPQNTYAVGATEFTFWIDASKYYAPNGIVFVPRMSVQEYDDKGKPTSKYPAYMPGDLNACYYKNTKGEWEGALISQYGFFTLPSGYKGYVRVPLEGFKPASWNADARPVMQLDKVIQINFYLFTNAGKNAMNTYALLDDFAFAGNNLKEMPAKYYEKAMDPAEGLVGSTGIVGEAISEDKIEGTKASVKWDEIKDFSKSYTVNLYKLENSDDQIGTLVSSTADIKDTLMQFTGLEKEAQYAVQVYAYNAAGERIAIYDYIKFTTLGKNDPVAANPKTGDNGITIATILVLFSGAILTLMSRKRKAENRR